MRKKHKIRKGIIGITIASALIAAGSLTVIWGNPETDEASGSTAVQEEASAAASKMLDSADLFTSRDLEQSADLSDAVSYTVTDNEDIQITEEGVYVISGSASNAVIYVEASTDVKVQLVLDNLNITNESKPCIYITQADKVFITTTGENTLSVTNDFIADENNKPDAVIFSKEDLVLNGTGQLTISSTDNGITGKDDLKITGGTYIINAGDNTIQANDSIRIAGGTFQLTAGSDGLHTGKSSDDTIGYLYIADGEFTIQAEDDALHAVTILQIDDGTFTIAAAEALEGTYIQINGGTLSIEAADDGVNAGYKSSEYYPTFELNGGSISITTGTGDTDAVDSNGDIIINGGTINITAASAFDCDGTAQVNGGTIIVNGEEVSDITNQFGMMVGMAGGMNGMAGGMDGMAGGMNGMPGGMGESGGGRSW